MKHLAYGLTMLLVLLAPALVVSPSLTEGAGQDDAFTKAFPHKAHLDQEMECADCHAKARTSKVAADDNLPSKEVCLDCHDEGGEEVGSVAWGAAPVMQTTAQKIEGGLVFSHEAHLDRGAECEYCHLDAEATQGEVGMPAMTSCSRCHENRAGLDDCAVCHAGTGILRPADHDLTWINHHREDARQDDSRCGTCHSADYCQECHEGGRALHTEEAPVEQFLPYGPQLAGDETLVQKAHELNYRFTHPLDAAGKESECRTCHSSETFCSDCHASEGDPSRFRPPWHGGAGWGAIPGAVGSGGGRHAEMARRDIELCAACHEVTVAGTDPACLDCHRDFSPGLGNDLRTHDRDFADDAVHGEWHDDDGAVCYICHTRSQAAGDAGFCGYCHGEK